MNGQDTGEKYSGPKISRRTFFRISALAAAGAVAEAAGVKTPVVASEKDRKKESVINPEYVPYNEHRFTNLSQDNPLDIFTSGPGKETIFFWNYNRDNRQTTIQATDLDNTGFSQPETFAGLPALNFEHPYATITKTPNDCFTVINVPDGALEFWSLNLSTKQAQSKGRCPIENPKYGQSDCAQNRIHPELVYSAIRNFNGPLDIFVYDSSLGTNNLLCTLNLPSYNITGLAHLYSHLVVVSQPEDDPNASESTIYAGSVYLDDPNNQSERKTTVISGVAPFCGPKVCHHPRTTNGSMILCADKDHQPMVYFFDARTGLVIKGDTFTGLRVRLNLPGQYNQKGSPFNLFVDPSSNQWIARFVLENGDIMQAKFNDAGGIQEMPVKIGQLSIYPTNGARPPCSLASNPDTLSVATTTFVTPDSDGHETDVLAYTKNSEPPPTSTPSATPQPITSATATKNPATFTPAVTDQPTGEITVIPPSPPATNEVTKTQTPPNVPGGTATPPPVETPKPSPTPLKVFLSLLTNRFRGK